MPLELRPIVESDFPDFVRIQFSAFASGIASKLVPEPTSPETIQKSIDKHLKSFRTESDIQYLKVVDTDQNGRMIAGAKWRINEKERTEEEIQVQLPKPGKDEEGNRAAADFMAYLSRERRTHMGTKPFYFLHMLITDPEHQRRGAGTLLLNWGLERADKAHLPSFLEATTTGKPLYAKFNFKGVYEEVFDLSKYGAQGTDTNTIMIREAVKEDDVSRY